MCSTASAKSQITKITLVSSVAFMSHTYEHYYMDICLTKYKIAVILLINLNVFFFFLNMSYLCLRLAKSRT